MRAPLPSPGNRETVTNSPKRDLYGRASGHSWMPALVFGANQNRRQLLIHGKNHPAKVRDQPDQPDEQAVPVKPGPGSFAPLAHDEGGPEGMPEHEPESNLPGNPNLHMRSADRKSGGQKALEKGASRAHEKHGLYEFRRQGTSLIETAVPTSSGAEWDPVPDWQWVWWTSGRQTYP